MKNVSRLRSYVIGNLLMNSSASVGLYDICFINEDYPSYEWQMSYPILLKCPVSVILRPISYKNVGHFITLRRINTAMLSLSW